MRTNRQLQRYVMIILGLLLAMVCRAQEASHEDQETIRALERNFEMLDHRLDVIAKAIDDITWYNKVGDIAFIDKVYIYGPPLWREENPTAQGAGNPVKFWSYIFIPKNIDQY